MTKQEQDLTKFEKERNRIREKIWTLISIKRGARVLDVGVGREAHSLKKLIELETSAFAIDIDLAALKKHRTHNVNMVQCNAARLPFGNSAFYASIAYFTLHEIDPSIHQDVFSELCRVSKKVMIVEPAPGKDLVYRVYQDIWTKAMYSIGAFEDYQPIDYWIGCLGKCGAHVAVSEPLVYNTKLVGEEVNKYMQMVIDEMKSDDVPDTYIKELKNLEQDVKKRGMKFSDVNVVVGTTGSIK